MQEALLLIFIAAAVTMPGCSGSTSPGGPALVTVAVTPQQANLFLGQTQQFQATVTGSANTTVTWLVGGIAGGSASVGTISPTGLYTAPSILPSLANITVTASSNADSQATGSATIAVKDDVVVQISPTSATVSTGAGQAFNATVTGTGAPSTAVTWSVNGIGGGNSALGTVASSGTDSALYVAPAVPPSPPGVTVTAMSVADPSKSASAAVTVTCSASNSIAPPSANVALAQTQTFTASFCTAPSNSVTWDVNGIAGGNATTGTIVSIGAATALYTAPSLVPAPNTVTIHATSGSNSAPAVVTIVSNITVGVSPSSASVQVSHRLSFSATLANTSELGVSWFVNGTPNGSAAVGQICQAGSNPCVAPAGPSAASMDYLAPAVVPPADPVTLMAVSQADPSKSGTAAVTVTPASGPVSIALSPFYSFLPPSTSTPSTMQFFATVTGNNNTAVTWSVQSAVTGQGCNGAACGSVDANGNFTAPATAPSPNAISVIGTSAADNTKFSSATVAVTSGVTIEKILPSSVTAGAVEAFPLTAQGLNFVPGGNGTGSTILLNGTPRSTICQNSTSCSTALNPADVQSATTLTVQIINPGNPGLLSNPVPFVIVPFDASEDVIALNSAQPTAAGKDITVVEPTTAAASLPLDVDFDGFLLNGGCEVEGTPLAVTRPVSGSTLVSLCIHGNGLDPTMNYEFTAPGAAPGDISVSASAVAGLFPNTIELDLQISNSTLPGVRTLFITSLNGDRGSATGILEVN